MKPNKLVFFIVFLLLGCSMVFVARGASGMPLYVSPNALSDIKTSIETEKNDIQNIKKLLEESKEKYNIYESLFNLDDKELEDRLIDELSYYKMLAGETEVEGAGVTVFVDDGTRELNEGENIDILLVHDQDILNILNALNKAGAEAISVNGQRLINTSAVSCSGYTIRINETFFARPFEIKAIGDQKKLTEELNGPDGVVTTLKLWGVKCEVKIEESLKLSKYTEN